MSSMPDYLAQAARALCVMQSLDAYFGTDTALNDDDKFLRQYVLNKVRYAVSSTVQHVSSAPNSTMAVPAVVPVHCTASVNQGSNIVTMEPCYLDCLQSLCLCLSTVTGTVYWFELNGCCSLL